MDDLAKMVPARKALLREGKTPNLKRSSNIEALIGQIVGTTADPECTHCTNGSGMWVKCVVADTFFGGSCCNCHYNNMGTRCSLSKFPDCIWGFDTWN